MFTGKVALLNQRRIADFHRVGNQTITGSEGEIIPQILVTVQVDLTGQVLKARRRDKEVDVRRAVAVAAQLIEQFLRRAVRRQP